MSITLVAGLPAAVDLIHARCRETVEVRLMHAPLSLRYYIGVTGGERSLFVQTTDRSEAHAAFEALSLVLVSGGAHLYTVPVNPDAEPL